ncbi:MAG TPA: response regulator transcription factor [Gaiellaceae bacterium]|nr:response regulator transcription factor [Gaiellaceae bacterium]
MTKILIVDDHPLILSGLRIVLSQAGGFDVVGEVRSGSEVLREVGRLVPDVVLLDMRMPGLYGIGCLDQIRARYPQTKVVVLSVSGDLDEIESAFAHGACGYVVKSIDLGDLASAVRRAVDGTTHHALGDRAVGGVDALANSGLTEREMTIVQAVARGLPNQAIARDLWVTEQTVKFHLTNIYRKLGVANRTEAARWVFARGVVSERDAGEHPVSAR